MCCQPDFMPWSLAEQARASALSGDFSFPSVAQPAFDTNDRHYHKTGPREGEKGLEQAIEAYNAAIADLRRHIETIAHAWQDAFDQRSERWQDSNAGIDARTAIEAWDELAEALEDVDLELPDLELPDAN